mmetsp:Transcript_47937/g.123754  ORF Transcript_47937/g.123754 Transcript_47937/m.123754 type:complete len:317 (+) Transcript_47937:266-1216(+)
MRRARPAPELQCVPAGDQPLQRWARWHGVPRPGARPTGWLCDCLAHLYREGRPCAGQCALPSGQVSDGLLLPRVGQRRVRGPGRPVHSVSRGLRAAAARHPPPRAGEQREPGGSGDRMPCRAQHMLRSRHGAADATRAARPRVAGADLRAASAERGPMGFERLWLDGRVRDSGSGHGEGHRRYRPGARDQARGRRRQGAEAVHAGRRPLPALLRAGRHPQGKLRRQGGETEGRRLRQHPAGQGLPAVRQVARPGGARGGDPRLGRRLRKRVRKYTRYDWGVVGSQSVKLQSCYQRPGTNIFSAPNCLCGAFSRARC